MAAPRVKVPETAKIGEIIEIKAMIQHEMETGLRKDKDGNVVPRKIINEFAVKFNGKDVFSTTIYPSVSANPYFAITFKVPASGEMELTWVEDGGEVTTLKKTITAA